MSCTPSVSPCMKPTPPYPRTFWRSAIMCRLSVHATELHGGPELRIRRREEDEPCWTVGAEKAASFRAPDHRGRWMSTETDGGGAGGCSLSHAGVLDRRASSKTGGQAFPWPPMSQPRSEHSALGVRRESSRRGSLSGWCFLQASGATPPRPRYKVPPGPPCRSCRSRLFVSDSDCSRVSTLCGVSYEEG